VIHTKADLWFKFDYGGDRSQITCIPDAKLSMLEFKVYTSEQVQQYETLTSSSVSVRHRVFHAMVETATRMS
jgi:hypothetical protein